MNRLERALDALLERGRAVRPISSSVRARVIARVRETANLRPSPLDSLDVAPPRRWSVRAIALVAALVAGVASASLGLSVRWSAPAPQPPPPGRPASLLALSSVLAPSASVAPPVDDSEPKVVASAAPAPVSRAVRAAPSESSARASYDEELALLQRAHGSYTSGDFESALALVAEHSRRFPGGVLAEQREALRVRSLARAGRSAESKRAAEAFAKRFPRSVLLPQLRKLSAE